MQKVSWFFSQNDLPDHLLFPYSDEAIEQVRSDKFILAYQLFSFFFMSTTVKHPTFSWFHLKWFYKEDDQANFDNMRLRHGTMVIQSRETCILGWKIVVYSDNFDLYYL